MKTDKTTLLVQLPADLKLQALVKAKQERKYLSQIIRAALIDFIAPKKTTGRGNINTVQIDKTKQFLREKHPETVRIRDIANFVGCDQVRAARLIDLLSGAENSDSDFLVYADDNGSYGISKDTETGIFV